MSATNQSPAEGKNDPSPPTKANTGSSDFANTSSTTQSTAQQVQPQNNPTATRSVTVHVSSEETGESIDISGLPLKEPLWIHKTEQQQRNTTAEKQPKEIVEVIISSRYDDESEDGNA